MAELPSLPLPFTKTITVSRAQARVCIPEPGQHYAMLLVFLPVRRAQCCAKSAVHKHFQKFASEILTTVLGLMLWYYNMVIVADQGSGCILRSGQ